MLTWYLPTLFGDIRLERRSHKTTRLILTELSSSERRALVKLRETALAPKWGATPWCASEAFPPINELEARETIIDLAAPLGKVQSVLATKLKPTRKLLSAVRFTNGRIEEVHGDAEDIAPTPSPYRESAKDKEPAPAAGTTVARPTRGCPRPDFDEADVRATRVLTAFLSDEQLNDFERKARFVVVGADTGHRYVLSSRYKLGKYGRSVFDVEERRPYCVHDYTVPASEELLALKLFLTLPGRETYVRAIPE